MVRTASFVLATGLLAAPALAQPLFQSGEKVELQASGDHWQSCVVTDPGAEERVMRMQCEPYDDGGYSRGGGVYVETYRSKYVRRPGTGRAAPVRAAQADQIAPPATNGTRAGAAAWTGVRPAAPAHAATGGSLPLGEYACYGSGMRITAGLAFKLLPGGRYADREGGNPGRYTIGSGTIRFTGGHLGGQVGREVSGKGFRIGAQATCERWG